MPSKNWIIALMAVAFWGGSLGIYFGPELRRSWAESRRRRREQAAARKR
jgi:hypothetical protein